MPLDSKDLPEPSSLLENTGEKFFIFYSSIVDGQLWCPDCRVVDDLIKATFSSEDGPHGTIIYVGDRPTWKNMGNKYRGAPFNVKSIPSVIKVADSKEVARLVDPDITAESLSAFVQQRD